MCASREVCRGEPKFNNELETIYDALNTNN